MENIFNTTLDISSVDETMIEDLNLNDYGSLDVEIKEPHLKLSTKEFLEALKIAKSTISSNSKDLISRLIVTLSICSIYFNFNFSGSSMK